MGSGSSKTNKTNVDAEKRAELQQWRAKTRFIDLPEEGLKAFSEFLSDGDRRSLDFWMKDPHFDADVLSPFITDGPNMLKYLDQVDGDPEDIVNKATVVSKYVKDLKIAMKPDLDSKFVQFQRELDKEINKLNG